MAVNVPFNKKDLNKENYQNLLDVNDTKEVEYSSNLCRSHKVTRMNFKMTDN